MGNKISNKISNQQKIKQLEQENTRLKEQLKNKLNEISPHQSIDELEKQSKILISSFVEELLIDKNINIKYVPDYIEKKIYENILIILIHMLDKILKTANIQLLNHKIIFDIVPIPISKED